MNTDTGLPFEPNPEGDRLRRLAQNVADGVLFSQGGPFSGANRLSNLKTARLEAGRLDASADFLTRFDHIIEAVETLDGVRRRMPKRDARMTLAHDIPRLSGSAHWPDRRAQNGLNGAYDVSLTAKFYDRPAGGCPPPNSSHEAPASPFSVGDRVRHQKFGLGVVTAIEGNRLLIDFDHLGEKKVIQTFLEKDE